MKVHDFTNILLGLETSPSMAKHIQEGMIERFDAFMTALIGVVSDVVILSGCQVSNVSLDYTVTAGKVYYNGEFLTVDAFTGTSASGTIPVFTSVTTTYSGNKALFGDRVLRDVLGSRKMVITMAASGSGILNCNAAKDIHYYMLGSNAVTNFTLLHGYTGIAGGTGNVPRYRKDAFGNVQFLGEIRSPASGLDVLFANIPVGYRPTKPKQFLVAKYGGSQEHVVCYIEVNGECSLFDSDTASVVTASKSWALDSVSFNIND